MIDEVILTARLAGAIGKPFRLRVKTPGGEHLCWAEFRGSSAMGGSGMKSTVTLTFRRLTMEGTLTNEVILATPADVLALKPAVMNLHYGELEVVE